MSSPSVGSSVRPGSPTREERARLRVAQAEAQKIVGPVGRQDGDIALHHARPDARRLAGMLAAPDARARLGGSGGGTRRRCAIPLIHGCPHFGGGHRLRSGYRRNGGADNTASAEFQLVPQFRRHGIATFGLPALLAFLAKWHTAGCRLTQSGRDGVGAAAAFADVLDGEAIVRLERLADDFRRFRAALLVPTRWPRRRGWRYAK